MKKRGKKAEGFLGMGFGMIFSIFLIIIFIITAIYAIKQFLDYKDCSVTGIFLKELQDKVTTVFNAQGSAFNFEDNLPSGIKYVCFVNFSDRLRGGYLEIGEDMSVYSAGNPNFFFYPREKACGGLKTKYISNLNIAVMTKNDNPYCIPVIKGKVSIKVSKGLNEGLVRLS